MPQFSEEKLSRLDKYLSSYIPDKIPGYSMLVCKDNKEVYYAQSGYKDVENKVDIARDDIFRIFSMTKSIVCCGALMLFERGQLHLDDPVDKYIPEWNNQRVYVSGDIDNMVTEPAKRKMVIRDLMTHTAGLTYGFAGTSPVNQMYDEKLWSNPKNSTMSSQDAVNALAEIPLFYSPGDFWGYSIGTDVLGIILERISGVTLSEFLDTNIFMPLNMDDTGFTVPAHKKSRFTNVYTKRDDNDGYDLIEKGNSSKYLNEPAFYSGGGGAVSTIDDYMKYLSLLVGRGHSNGQALMGEKTVKLLMANQFDQGVYLDNYQKENTGFPFAAGIGYSPGGAVNVEPFKGISPLSTPGEYFWFGAAFTLFWVDPTDNISVVFMSHILNNFRDENGKNIMRDIRTLVNSSLV